MGSIFSRTTSDQLKAIKAFLRAAQKATPISFNSEKKKKKKKEFYMPAM